MEYRITLTRLVDERYVYVFTAKCQSLIYARHAYKLLKERFAEPEFKLEVTEWQNVGKVVNLDEI